MDVIGYVRAQVDEVLDLLVISDRQLRVIDHDIKSTIEEIIFFSNFPASSCEASYVRHYERMSHLQDIKRAEYHAQVRTFSWWSRVLRKLQPMPVMIVRPRFDGALR